MSRTQRVVSEGKGALVGGSCRDGGG
uniref:Uncharacterized protein n=1 Tax=Moniliophthora roreri TaxID=221103 RepID=A0A0W0FYV0_MONRR